MFIPLYVLPYRSLDTADACGDLSAAAPRGFVSLPNSRQPSTVVSRAWRPPSSHARNSRLGLLSLAGTWRTKNEVRASKPLADFAFVGSGSPIQHNANIRPDSASPAIEVTQCRRTRLIIVVPEGGSTTPQTGHRASYHSLDIVALVSANEILFNRRIPPLLVRH